MRIVVWNCKQALSRKKQHLYELRPDLAIIPECARKCLELFAQDGNGVRWVGENPDKGLGILVAKPWRIVRLAKPANKWIVPLWITGPCDFLLLAVWASKVTGSTARSYIGQLHDSIVNHPRWFQRNQVIIAGDFNSNKQWDGKRELTNHSAVVSLLQKHGLASAYHSFYGESQGAETRHTYYQWHRNEPKCRFHIDYVFVPKDWMGKITSVEVGTHAHWSKLSDHVPLIVDAPVPTPPS